MKTLLTRPNGIWTTQVVVIGILYNTNRYLGNILIYLTTTTIKCINSKHLLSMYAVVGDKYKATDNKPHNSVNGESIVQFFDFLFPNARLKNPIRIYGDNSINRAVDRRRLVRSSSTGLLVRDVFDDDFFRLPTYLQPQLLLLHR